MYSTDPNLDNPPPHPQFRRPWSPDYYHPLPSSHQQRREASDVSIEALDLADYAMTLDAPTRISHYTPASIPTSPHSHESLAIAPSLDSSRSTYFTAPRNPIHRPFSLPSTPSLSSHATSSQSRTRLHPSFHRSPHAVEPNRLQTPSEEIDISHFPKWSRNWYRSKPNNNVSPNSTSDPDADIYTPVPTPSFDLAGQNKKSVFDPGYIHDPRNPDHDQYLAFDARSPPLYSSAHNSTRDLLPWNNDSPQYEPPLDPALREERMQMLEKEFGDKAKGSKKDDPLLDQNGKPVVGTIDHQGRLVTVGPKKRVFIRALQILLAVIAAVPSIYAALAIKSSDPKNPPPPANKPPAYVLYTISVITFFILLYLFVIRPCCCIRNKSSSLLKHPLGASGMMVLPIHGQGGKKAKKPKGKYGANPSGQDVQINLVVDPTAFQHPNVSESEDSEDDTLDGGKVPKTKKRNHRKRRGVFEGLAMEEQWLAARARLRKMTMVDVAGLIVWGATFVFVLIGKRCPSGGFKGWCNAYNVSSAAACLLCVAFGVSIFFDVQDLHASKQSPRTRT